jgi:hypothetical protein
VREIRHPLDMGNLSDLILNPPPVPRIRRGYQCVTGGDSCPGHISKHMLCDPPAVAMGGIITRNAGQLAVLGTDGTECVFPGAAMAKALDEHIAAVFTSVDMTPPAPLDPIGDIRRMIERLNALDEPSEYVTRGLWLTGDELDQVKRWFACDRPVEPRFLAGLDQLLGISLYQAGCDGCSNAPGRGWALCACSTSCGSPRCMPLDGPDAAHAAAIHAGYLAKGCPPDDAVELALRAVRWGAGISGRGAAAAEVMESLVGHYVDEPEAADLVAAFRALAAARLQEDTTA